MGLFWRGPTEDVSVPVERLRTGQLGDVCLVSGRPAAVRMSFRAWRFPRERVQVVVGAMNSFLLADKVLGRVPVSRAVWTTDLVSRWVGRLGLVLFFTLGWSWAQEDLAGEVVMVAGLLVWSGSALFGRRWTRPRYRYDVERGRLVFTVPPAAADGLRRSGPAAAGG